MMFCRPVTPRAILTALSTASLPPAKEEEEGVWGGGRGGGGGLWLS
jgi:hypothetical protein